jgi:Rv2258c-like winged HTH domain
MERAAAEHFAERMLGVLNHAMLGLQISLGHQVGLYDLMSRLEPGTAEGIAREAGLDERYVREWLDGQVVGGIIQYDSAPRTYVLPSEHAASLTREAGPENLAVLAPYIALCGEVEQHVVRSFREGGGVAYDRYSRFQELQAAESARGLRRLASSMRSWRSSPVWSSVSRLESTCSTSAVGRGTRST